MTQPPPHKGPRVVPPGQETDGIGQFRPEINVNDILADFNRRWANQGPPKIDPSLQWWQQEPGAIDYEDRRREDEERRLKAENDPYRVGRLPVEFSTCTALVVPPVLCWDVNGYYRTMGVHWRATKKELMTAFHEFGPMPTAYQMYVFKQLLNVAIRREYDLSPLGAPYLNDDYVQDAMKMKASDEARRRSMQGTPVSAQDIINEKYDFIPEGDTPNKGLDGAPDMDESAELSEPPPTFQWPYSFFLWRTKENDDTQVRLSRWQGYLIKALAAEGIEISIAVGSHGKQVFPYAVVQVGDTKVVFLNEKEEPTEELAASVASTISTMR